MNWGYFYDPFCYLCLPETVVASRFLTQEIAGSYTAILFLNYIIFVTESLYIGKTQMTPLFNGNYINFHVPWCTSHECVTSHRLMFHPNHTYSDIFFCKTNQSDHLLKIVIDLVHSHRRIHYREMPST